jgi:PRTRC genetic system protein A
MHTVLDELAAAFGPTHRFHIATPDAPLPPPQLGVIYIWAANGIFKQGANDSMLARICVEPFTQPFAGLGQLDITIQWRAWTDDRLPGALLQEALEEARQSGIPGENITYPTEAQLFIVAWAGHALLIKPPQIGSSTRVFSSAPAGPILCDIHSHHQLAAFFSETDDRDDLGLSASVVIGNIFSAPEIVCRINVYGNSLIVPAATIFDSIEPFVDCALAPVSEAEESIHHDHP